MLYEIVGTILAVRGGTSLGIVQDVVIGLNGDVIVTYMDRLWNECQGRIPAEMICVA